MCLALASSDDFVARRISPTLDPFNQGREDCLKTWRAGSNLAISRLWWRDLRWVREWVVLSVSTTRAGPHTRSLQGREIE